MNYRTVELLAKQAFTTDTTKVIDINIAAPISSLVLCTQGTNASATMTAHYVKCLTKVEIVDGSEVLLSLDGPQLEALDWYSNKGNFRKNWNFSLNGGRWERAIGINFGRFLWDRLYALDPTKFTNLQLKVSIDVNGGGSSNTPFDLYVFANVFDERVPEIRGVLMTKEIKSWTVSSGVHEYTDLPTDYPYRAMYLRAFVLGTEPNQCIDTIKLSEDTDKKIPINIGGTRLVPVLCGMYPKVSESFYYAITTGTTVVYITASTNVTAQICSWNASALSARDYSAWDGDGCQLDVIGSAASNAVIHVEGDLPHAVFEIPVGDKSDPDDSYDVRNIGSLKLDVLGVATSAASLFIQQYRHY